MEHVTLFDEPFPYQYGLTGASPSAGEDLSDGVVKQLEFALTVGLLNDGDKLPSEPRLAEQLRVSTVTLRQGLAKLRTRGMLVTQRGRGGGSYLQDSEHLNSSRAAESLRASSSTELRDLGDLFAGLVGRSAQLAARRALPEELARLRQLVLALEGADTPNLRRRAYCRLHIDLAVAAQSPRLMLSTVQLLGELSPLIWNSGAATDSALSAHYGAIVDAIRDRDTQLAPELAHEQIESEIRLLVAHRMRLETRT